MAFCLPSAEFHYFGFAECKILPLSCLIRWNSNSEGLLKVTGQWLNVILLLLLHWIIYFFFNDLQYSGSTPPHTHTNTHRHILKYNSRARRSNETKATLHHRQTKSNNSFFLSGSFNIYTFSFTYGFFGNYVAIVYFCCFLFTCSWHYCWFAGFKPNRAWNHSIVLFGCDCVLIKNGHNSQSERTSWLLLLDNVWQSRSRSEIIIRNISKGLISFDERKTV